MLSLEPHTIIPYATVCPPLFSLQNLSFNDLLSKIPEKGMEFVLMLNILAVFAQFVRRR
jgi:hypothetical protein